MQRPRRAFSFRSDGNYWGYCDRCGYKVRKDQLKMDWLGLWVCTRQVNNCYEERHPLDFVRGIPDNMTVSRPRDLDPGAGYVGGYTECVAGEMRAGTSYAGTIYPRT